MNTPNPSSCPRCGSKQIISKTWVETIETYTGSNQITFSKIICTNTVCQDAFDKAREEEKMKKEALKKQREEREAKRKSAQQTH